MIEMRKHSASITTYFILNLIILFFSSAIQIYAQNYKDAYLIDSDSIRILFNNEIDFQSFDNNQRLLKTNSTLTFLVVEVGKTTSWIDAHHTVDGSFNKILIWIFFKGTSNPVEYLSIFNIIDLSNNPPNVDFKYKIAASIDAPFGYVDIDVFSRYMLDDTIIKDVIENHEILIQSPPGSINLLYPDENTWWIPGKTYEIKWTDDFSDDVKIDLSKHKDNNVYLVVTDIAYSTDSDGSYDWTVPSSLDPDNRYQVIIRQKNNASVNDLSGDFKIAPGGPPKSKFFAITIPA